MPEYTTRGIRYPIDNDYIRGSNASRTIVDDFRDLAQTADNSDGQVLADANIAISNASQQVKNELRSENMERFAFVETLAAQPGSRVVNLVADPHPADPEATWEFGYIQSVIAPSPNWARAIADGQGQTSIRPILHSDDERGEYVSVTPGSDIGFRVRLRGMPSQDISATVYLSAPGTGVFLTTEQQGIDAGETIWFSAQGTVPTGATSARMLITFRTRGETYAQQGHFLYWREAALYIGNIPPYVQFTSGDGEYSYWTDEPNNSASVTVTPREYSGSGEDTADAGLQRAAIVDAALKRRGRRIGTGGKAAITLRFDHHLDQFNDKIVPILQQHRLPWSQMLNVGRFGTGNDNLTPTQIQNLCFNNGGEVWNHTYSHSNITSEAEADREITRGLEDLRIALPGLWIDNFVGAGQADLMGMEGSNTPEKFYGTYPGRLVLAQHAFIQGHYPGTYHRLAGPNLIGAAHHTIDKLSWSSVSGIIRGAVNRGAGLILMLHPNYLDRPGYITTATLQQAFELIAQARDDGDAVVLTNTAMLMADSAHSDRWSLTSGAGAIPGTINGVWPEVISGRSAQTQYGVPHEATVTLTPSQSGPVRLRAHITHPGGVIDQDHQLDGVTGQTVTLRVLVTPPRGTTRTEISLEATGQHDGIKYWAV